MRTSPWILARLAGIVWLGVGSMLAFRGFRMASGEASSSWTLAIAIAVGALVGIAKGWFVLSKAAERNRRRIFKLDPPKIYQVFAPKFFILIALMIGLGIGLRALGRTGYLGGMVGVGGLYMGIGAALVASSRVYFRRTPPDDPITGPALTATPSLPPPQKHRVGVLISNLGTPDAPTTTAVRRYLREFLGDARVVEVARPIWWCILNLIILPLRSPKSAAAYRKVWTKDGSPLAFWTERTAEGVAQELGQEFAVRVGMRYGKPSMRSAIDGLIADGCDEIIALPLYPQSSNTTTGTTYADLWRIAADRRDVPSVRCVPPYFDDSLYIDALAKRIEESLGMSAPAALAANEVSFFVWSFHGLPEEYVRKGDPYVDHCQRTAWALATRLGLERTQWELIFQSRFGSKPWLQPYLDEFVPALASKHPRILVAVPGFAADCLETLEEVGMELREDFMEAGGEKMVLVPALNDHPAWIHALSQLVLRNASAKHADASPESRASPPSSEPAIS